MINEQEKLKINKFLTEYMGYIYFTGNDLVNIDFFTWEGFGKAWEYSQKQPWFSFEFIEEHLMMPYDAIDTQLINPEKYAVALYEFLKAK